MGRYRKTISIGARRSTLARTQAEAVGRALGRAHAGLTVRYHWIESEGDAVQGTLADVGGKGLFTSAIERELLAGTIDVAVHSMKDLPVADGVERGLVVAAVPRRGDVHDCLVSLVGGGLDALPAGATVGTSGPRRVAQIKRLRADLEVRPIRGNVQTRVRKVVDEGVFDATLLAVAGLQRVGMGEYAQHPIDPEQLLPAAGQGALAVQCRRDDHAAIMRCVALNDPVAAELVAAERAVVAALDGDCHSPIAVLAERAADNSSGEYRMRARVLSAVGDRVVSADDRQAGKGALDALAKHIIDTLRSGGAQDVLTSCQC